MKASQIDVQSTMNVPRAAIDDLNLMMTRQTIQRIVYVWTLVWTFLTVDYDSFQLLNISIVAMLLSFHRKDEIALTGIPLHGFVIRVSEDQLYVAAAFVERQLYKSAHTNDDYCDLSSLPMRMSVIMSVCYKNYPHLFQMHRG